MLRLLVMVAVLLLSVNVWAGELIKSNSLTMDTDAGTNSWTATCDFSVSGVDQLQPYSGSLYFAFVDGASGHLVFEFHPFFQVDPENRTWTETSPGSYKFTAKLRGQNVTAHLEVTLGSIAVNSTVFCDAGIAQGTHPLPPGTPSLVAAQMRSDVIAP